MRIRLLFAGLVVLLSLALYGCDMGQPIGAGVSTQNRAAGLSQGWTRYGGADEGFSIDLPAGWMKLDVSGSALESSIRALGDTNPQLASYLNNPALKSQLSNLLASSIKLILYDATANIAASQFATNMNLGRTEVPGGLSLAQVVKNEIDEVKSTAGVGLVKNLTQDEMPIGKLPAERIGFTYGMFSPNYTYMDIGFSQYIILDGNTEYILTFTTTSNEAKLRSITFDGIANTFRITR